MKNAFAIAAVLTVGFAAPSFAHEARHHVRHAASAPVVTTQDPGYQASAPNFWTGGRVTNDEAAGQLNTAGGPPGGEAR